MNDYYTVQEMLNEDEAGLEMFSAMDDPVTYEEACKDDKWVQAMNVEMTAIERNQHGNLLTRQLEPNL